MFTQETSLVIPTRNRVACLEKLLKQLHIYKISFFENDKFYKLELVPISKGMKESLKKIVLYFDKNVSSVVKLDMIEPTGDNTLIEFSNKKINAIIPPEKFTLK